MTRTIKVLLLGPSRVGKTSLACRLKFDRFEQDPAPTIGVEMYEFQTLASHAPTRVFLWDTDSELGDDLFDSEFARGADAALIVADVTQPETIDAATGLQSKFLEKFSDAFTVLAINKSDDPQVNKDWIQSLLAERPGDVLCSAKSGDGVKQLIERMTSPRNA